MAALSPAHFLLWARLTTASPTPSVTPSEGTIRQTSVGVSSSTCPRHKFYQCAPPPPIFSWIISEQMSACVCVCVRVSSLCVSRLAQLAGSLSLSLPLFLPPSVTLQLHPSDSTASPSIPPCLLLLLPGVWMRGTS